ncbi:GDSL-type esterase/lipase family protein [Streptomyces sp. NPDC048304]|uniref:GDSL-type esterase/lipase family protein n=1 Tax=Streptomyces sp. NPDC048304 TaxID=3154820 RepID=UPI00340A86FA
MACAAVTGGLLQAAPANATPASRPSPRPTTAPTPSGRVQSPDEKLGKGWQKSPDRAVTAAADADGLHILVADSGKAYAWKTVAVLSEPGMPADSWIGNQCVMDHTHAAVAYAPRTFTNKPDLMQGGAFTAIVDLTTGKVTKLPFTASLAYFDPSCNTTTHQAAFTGFRDMNDPASTRTRVITVNVSGKTTGTAAAKGEITSAVPVKDGTVAALGSRLVHLDRSGKVKNLAHADSAPFDIRPAADGRIAFVDRRGDSTAHAKLFTGSAKPKSIASGKLGDLDLMQGEAGRVFLTGHPKGSPAVSGTGVTRLEAPAGSDVSSHGRLATEPVLTPGVRAGLTHIKGAGKGFTKTGEPTSRTATPADDGEKSVTVTSTATTTGAELTQSVRNDTSDGSGHNPSPVLVTAGAAHRPKVTSSKAGLTPSSPTDDDRWCGVSRNDVKVQALQPTSNQVEWAVDMAVRGDLSAAYITQGGYRDQAGLGTVDPQALFPLPKLTGGGRIPANVLLGIMAQESNLWQAEGGSIPGQMGNPLAAVDGYYGHKADPNDPAAYWQINWDKSDCGYGVGQVTDGMRLAGHEKTDAGGHKEQSLSPGLQKLVAIDYATNVAASLKILADKWNEVHKDGQKITVNNDDPSKVENWFTAVWNYNLGFNPPSDAGKNGGHWGLGWYNNPANPIYAKGWGHPFMNTDVDGPEANKDAAHPQDWPYELKVMGWSAWSIDTGYSYATSGRQDWPGESGFSSAGFRPAYWNGADLPVLAEGSARNNRWHVSPDLDVFCNSKNNCNPSTPPDCPDAACYAQYWWNQPNATWKSDCATTCGFENIKYQTLVKEPGRGTRLQTGTPVCSGAPDGAKVVASVPDGTPSWSTQSGCATVHSAGSFQFSFNPGTEGRYEAKADLHSVGGGYGGHYWYTRTRDTDHYGGPNGYMTIDGTWTLGQSLTWARVLVHLPDTGAQTRQATYHVLGTDSTSSQRVVLQRAGGWVSLGAFHFTGTPRVELSNTTGKGDGTADEDIAWGAVAFQPLPGKPANSIVAMGDSYSSGEGVSAPGGGDFYQETDHYDKNNDKAWDSCHRSKLAWSEQAVLPGQSVSVGAMDTALDPKVDYHFVACSGARTYNMLKQGQNSEVAQIDAGYLDNNTTLVTLSVGGNDARFSDVFNQCVLKAGLDVCQDTSIGNKDPDTGQGVDGDTGPLKDWAPKWLHDQVRPRIVKVLNAIHTAAPHAKIILMGYPELLSAGGQCVPGVGTEEAPWLNSVADTLDEEMKGAAADSATQKGANVVFADPRSEFQGKTVCGDPEDVNGIVKTGLSHADNTGVLEVGMASFHPKIAGARLYANVLERALK